MVKFPTIEGRLPDRSSYFAMPDVLSTVGLTQQQQAGTKPLPFGAAGLTQQQQADRKLPSFGVLGTIFDFARSGFGLLGRKPRFEILPYQGAYKDRFGRIITSPEEEKRIESAYPLPDYESLHSRDPNIRLPAYSQLEWANRQREIERRKALWNAAEEYSAQVSALQKQHPFAPPIYQTQTVGYPAYVIPNAREFVASIAKYTDRLSPELKSIAERMLALERENREPGALETNEEFRRLFDQYQQIARTQLRKSVPKVRDRLGISPDVPRMSSEEKRGRLDAITTRLRTDELRLKTNILHNPQYLQLLTPREKEFIEGYLNEQAAIMGYKNYEEWATTWAKQQADILSPQVSALQARVALMAREYETYRKVLGIQTGRILNEVNISRGRQPNERQRMEMSRLQGLRQGLLQYKRNHDVLQAELQRLQGIQKFYEDTLQNWKKYRERR